MLLRHKYIFFKLSQNLIDSGSIPYDSFLALSKCKVVILIEIDLLIKIGKHSIVFENCNLTNSDPPPEI